MHPRCSQDEWADWEIENVVTPNVLLLEEIRLMEADAMDAIDEFLRRHPPSAPPETVPDDILG